jgi:hypothetical protein
MITKISALDPLRSLANGSYTDAHTRGAARKNIPYCSNYGPE